LVDAPSSAARRGAGGLFRLRPAAVQPSAICGLGYFTAWNIRIVPVVIRRVGGGAPRLPRCWPPSATQTWCAVFPDHAFTKVPCWHSWFQQSPFLHRERSTAPDGPTSSPFLGRPRGVDVYGCSEQSENGNRPQSPAHLYGLDQTVTDEEIARLRAWADGSEALDQVACRIIRREIDREQKSAHCVVNKPRCRIWRIQHSCSEPECVHANENSWPGVSPNLINSATSERPPIPGCPPRPPKRHE